MIYFRRPPFWKLCHPERAFSRIADSLSFLDLKDLGAVASGAAIPATGTGAADTGMDDVGGIDNGP